MVSLVGKTVKYLGDYDDVISRGWDYHVHTLFCEKGVVTTHDPILGWCRVEYVSPFITDRFMIPVELLEVVDASASSELND